MKTRKRVLLSAEIMRGETEVRGSFWIETSVDFYAEGIVMRKTITCRSYIF